MRRRQIPCRVRPQRKNQIHRMGSLWTLAAAPTDDRKAGLSRLGISAFAYAASLCVCGEAHAAVPLKSPKLSLPRYFLLDARENFLRNYLRVLHKLN